MTAKSLTVIDENIYQFTKPERDPDYRIVNERYLYEAIWQAEVMPDWPPQEKWNTYLLRIRQGFDQDKAGPWAFNWIVRRDPCFMTSGDLPRFALEETPTTSSLAPPFFKMGDLRIRMTIRDESFWLDEQGKVIVHFHAWGTVHQVDLSPKFPLKIELIAFLAKNKGFGVNITIAGQLDKPVTGKIELFYGGLDRRGPNDFPEYFRNKPEEELDDTLVIDGRKVVLSDNLIPYRVAIITEPEMVPVLSQDSMGHPVFKRAKYSFPFNTATGSHDYRCLSISLMTEMLSWS